MAAESETMVKHAHGTFEASPDAPGRARLFVTDALDRWGIAEGQARDSLLLLTSELVTNAIRYCRRRVQVDLHYEDGAMRVEVLDESPLTPAEREPDELSEKGRGLKIVDALASRWGVTDDEPGKRVWFELVLDPSTAETAGTS